MNKANFDQITAMQEENYSNRIGFQFGIFNITNIEYNWVTHTQEWTIACTKCGNEETVNHDIGRDWVRGKGRNQYKCKYCIKAEKESEKISKMQKKASEEAEKDSFIGNVVNGWTLYKRDGSTFTAYCQECGRQRKITMRDVVNSSVPVCSHKKDFSDPEYIGMRFGNLTVLKYEHGQFIVRCDCGFEKPVKCSALINKKTTTCGRVKCEYHNRAMDYFGKHGSIVRKIGENTENEVKSWLEKLGYTVQSTPCSGDYGVDLICTGKDGSLVAIQVKNNATTKAKASVSAVQEVYAGGKYYDCVKFVVVSYTGFTDNAKNMADKLGVMLCNERCELFDFSKSSHFNTKHFWVVDGNVEPMIETFKRNGWYSKNIGRFADMTYEQVKKHFENKELRKQQSKIMEKYGVSEQKVYYRMTKMGMTFEEAVTEPNKTMGRPRKKEDAV